MISILPSINREREREKGNEVINEFKHGKIGNR